MLSIDTAGQKVVRQLGFQEGTHLQQRRTALNYITLLFSKHFLLTVHRKRQNAVMVTANDIRLRDIRNNDLNQLQFSMFVQTNIRQNVLLPDTVQRALQVSLGRLIPTCMAVKMLRM